MKQGFLLWFKSALIFGCWKLTNLEGKSWDFIPSVDFVANIRRLSWKLRAVWWFSKSLIRIIIYEARLSIMIQNNQHVSLLEWKLTDSEGKSGDLNLSADFVANQYITLVIPPPCQTISWKTKGGYLEHPLSKNACRT